MFLAPPLNGSTCVKKTWIMVVSGRERTLTLSPAIWMQYTNVTDGRTDGQRDGQTDTRCRKLFINSNSSVVQSTFWNTGWGCFHGCVTRYYAEMHESRSSQGRMMWGRLVCISAITRTMLSVCTPRSGRDVRRKQLNMPWLTWWTTGSLCCTPDTTVTSVSYQSLIVFFYLHIKIKRATLFATINNSSSGSSSCCCCNNRISMAPYSWNFLGEGSMSD